MYPALEFDFQGSLFMLNSYYRAYGSQGKIIAEQIEQPD